MIKFLDQIKYFNKQINTKTEQTVARILFNYSIKLSTVESCTGGLLSSRLTDIAGSSSYIKENFITYANESKIELLNVSPETLEKFGSVSEECAIEMAEGLYQKTGCDIAISTTGVAGPTVPEEGTTVGVLFVAIKNKYITKVKKFEVNPHHSRKMIKFLFSQSALEFLIEFLNENYVNSIQQLSDSTTQDNL
ncbi:MAG: CinA family protein [Candidatus Gastranaerophilaceae bacterium]